MVSVFAPESGGQEPQASGFPNSLSSPLLSVPDDELFCLFPCCGHLSGENPGRGTPINRDPCGVGFGGQSLAGAVTMGKGHCRVRDWGFGLGTSSEAHGCVPKDARGGTMGPASEVPTQFVTSEGLFRFEGF